jgi:hypothetical protein
MSCKPPFKPTPEQARVIRRLENLVRGRCQVQVMKFSIMEEHEYGFAVHPPRSHTRIDDREDIAKQAAAFCREQSRWFADMARTIGKAVKQ